MVLERQTAAADAAGDPVAPPGRARRTLRWHVAALACVLAVGFLLSDPTAPSLSDEGAALAQVDALHDGDGWLVEHPLPEVDPELRAFPIDLSMQSAGTTRFAPLAKHPVYAWLLARPYAVAGVPGAFATSVLGTLAAAVVAALLSRRLRPGLEVTTLWLVGVGSPLVFDAHLLIAHSLGAALVGGAVLALLAPRRRVLATAAGLALLLGAQLLRNEAVLFGVALALGLTWSAARTRRPGRLAQAGAVLATTAFAYRLDEWLAGRVLGPGSTTPFVIERQGSFVDERLTGAYNALARLPEGGPVAGLLIGAVLVLFALAAVRARRPAPDPLVPVLILAAGVVAAAAYVLAPVGIIFGALFASPCLVLGLLLLDRDARRDPIVELLGVTAVLFVGAVLATQYADAGNSWGGRYLTIGIPVVGPLAALGLDRLRHAVPAARVPAVRAGLVLVAASWAAMAVTYVSVNHGYAQAVHDVVAPVTAQAVPGDGDDRPIVLTTTRGFGRLLWPLTRDQRWLNVPDGDLAAFGERLHDRGVTQLVLLTEDLPDRLDELAPWYRPDGPAGQAIVRPGLRQANVLNPVVIRLRRV